ncbi:MAG TPA: amidase family protein [Thermoanaerobaculia bacterium]|nr:amidase family protein [Thermoanaerobaculia bacterium]
MSLPATTRRQFLHRAGALAASAALLPRQPVAGAQPRTHPAADSGELGFEPAVDLVARLRRKEIGSEELTRYFIGRIERYDEKLNAVVVRDFERALEAARTADTALARGESLGPLHGLPMTIKESFDIVGLPTTWGRPDAAKSVARADAVVVERFARAGAHFLGKTNVPRDLADFQSYNEVYGTTRNPWDPARTPGGSSGGSAVALAAGMTGLESGSDIGGSIRNPAHYCGVYGHKPTLGIVPTRGHQPPGAPALAQDPDLAVVGPLARSAQDLALALEVLAGPDVLRSPGWRLELPPPRMTSVSALRVALWPDDPTAPVATEIADRVAEFGQRLSGLGAKVSDSARPAFSGRQSHDLYLPLLGATMAGPGAELPFGQWVALNGRRTRLRMQWQEFFRDWDVLICPITTTAAFPLDEGPRESRTLEVDGEERSYFEQIFWAGLATLSYLPSTVFPTGLSEQGLPIGLQAIGAELDDRTTIELARLVALELGGFTPPPGYGG